MRKKFIIRILLLLIFVLGGSMAVNKKSEASDQYVAVKAKKIFDDGRIQLADGKMVILAGIDAQSYNEETLGYIEKLIRDKHVLFLPDNLATEDVGYLFLMEAASEMLPDDLKPGEPDGRGFLNVKKGFNKVKIFAYNLNVILIKAGYAKADKEAAYQYKDIFIEYEGNR